MGRGCNHPARPSPRTCVGRIAWVRGDPPAMTHVVVNREAKQLARRLRALRGLAAYTQAQVAYAIRVRREVIAEIERGARYVSASELSRLAWLYGLTLDDLVAGIGRAGRDPGKPRGRVRPPVSIKPPLDDLPAFQRRIHAGRARRHALEYGRRG